MGCDRQATGDRTEQLALFGQSDEAAPSGSGTPGGRRVGDTIAAYLILLASLNHLLPTNGMAPAARSTAAILPTFPWRPSPPRIAPS